MRAGWAQALPGVCLRQTTEYERMGCGELSMMNCAQVHKAAQMV